MSNPDQRCLVGAVSILAMLLLRSCVMSNAQGVQSARYADFGPTVDEETFRGECRDVVANFTAEQDANTTEMFCKCVRTGNKNFSAILEKNTKSNIFTALLHGLLPLGNPAISPIGTHLLWSSYLTLFHINNYATDDIRLFMALWQTDCDTQRTSRTLVDLLMGNLGTGVLGPACSTSSELFNNLSPYLSMADVSYSVESATLSDRKRYSSFYRVSATSRLYGAAWVQTMKRLDWTSTSIIIENRPEFQAVLDDLQRNAGDGIEIKAQESIRDDISAGFNVDTVWSNIRRAKTRIVVIMAYQSLGSKILCTAYHKGFSGMCCPGKTRMIFVVPGWYSENWHTARVSTVIEGVNYTCTTDQMLEMVAHSFSTSQQLYRDNEDEELNIAGDYWMSAKRWKELNTLTARYCLPSPSIPIGYDSLMHDSIVLYYKAFQLLQETLATATTTYRTLDHHLNYVQGRKLLAIRWILVYLIGKVNFEGISGAIRFEDLDYKFTSGVREADEQIELIMQLNNITNITGDFMASSTGRPTQATIRQRQADGTDRVIAVLDHNFSIIQFFEESLTWGVCCSNSIPSAVIPDDLPCQYLSQSLVGQLGGCSQALGFIIGLSIGLCLLMFAIIAVLWRRWYKRKLRLFKRAASYGLNMNADDLQEKTELLSKFEIPRECVIINRRLGEGAFGAVFGGELISERCTSKSSVNVVNCAGVAVKTLHDNASNEEKSQFLSEGQLMTRFEHENIVRLLGFCTRDEPFYVVMELMMHGDLKGYLLSYRHLCGSGDPSELNSERLTSMVKQVARGMAYLADQRFVHRDIAARNCMVTVNYTVKIGDFGMARDMYMNDYYRVKEAAPLPVRWMAQETLFDGRFTLDSDMWSFGVVVWEVITFGEIPFPGMSNHDVIERVREGRHAAIPQHCPKNLKKFILACWVSDAEARMTAAAAASVLDQESRLVVPCVEAPKARKNPWAVARDSLGNRGVSFRTRREPTETANGLPVSNQIAEEGLSRSVAQSLELVDETGFNEGRYVIAPLDVQQGARDGGYVNDALFPNPTSRM